MVKTDADAGMSRRGFLRMITALGGGIGLSLFLEACSKAGIATETLIPPTGTRVAPSATLEPTATSIPAAEASVPTATYPIPSATPTELVEEGIARIAFVKTQDRAEGVRKAIELLGSNPVTGKHVFLKPNFNSADPTPGSTHPDVLRALVMKLNEMGASGITVGDRSGMGDTRRVMDRLGVFRLGDELGFETVIFDDLEVKNWVTVQPQGSHWTQGFPIARACLEAQALVQTCCLKTHRYGGHFTLSLKNSVGMVAKRFAPGEHDFMQELHNSSHQRRMIAEVNAAYKPALVVMDGVEAFISGGPDNGERVAPEVIIAGADRVAIDAVGVALLRYFGCQTEASRGKIFEQEQIARAVELGLGVDSPEKIVFVTSDAESAAYSEAIGELLAGG